MSSLSKIICLENSWRENERCISGIDISTGKWVRAVCDSLYPEDGRIPKNTRLVQGREPELLDILGIPLAETGNGFGFQPENRSILSGEWVLLGKAKSSELIPYCKKAPYILHNPAKFVKPSYLQGLSIEQRHTVQLIQPTKFSVISSTGKNNNRVWKGSIEIANGQFLENLTITDPVFVKHLDEGYLPSNDCLIVVSLNMPWASVGWQGEKCCWKLIAGVIDLVDHQASTIADLISQIDLEIKRVGWNVDQESSYIDHNFHKRTRNLLNLDELQKFVVYLESLPSKTVNIPNLPIPEWLKTGSFVYIPDHAQGVGRIIEMDDKKIIAIFEGYSIPVQVTDWRKILNDGKIFPAIPIQANQPKPIPSSTIKPNPLPVQPSVDNYRIYPANRPNSGHIPKVKFWNHIFPSILCVSLEMFVSVLLRITSPTRIFTIYVIARWIGAWIRYRLLGKTFKKSIVCRAKGWKITKQREIEKNRNFIGLGEDELYAKLSDSNIDVLRQVQIDKSYKADFVCFNNETDKLCVVEVDGQQHRNDQNQIDRDNLRMYELADLGVPTIRFLNQYAKNNPMICAKLIKDLLK